MAEGGNETDAEDRTEAPTPRRLEKAREEGQVALSREVVQLASLAAGTVATAMFAPAATRSLIDATAALFSRVAHDAAAEEATSGLLGAVLPLGVVVASVAGAAAIAATLLQTRFLVSAKMMAPKASKLSPIAGMKRLFGKHALEELVRTVLKLGGCVGGAWLGVLTGAPEALMGSLSSSPSMLAGTLGNQMYGLFLGGIAGLAAVAALDLLYVHISFQRDMRMSREDLRQETKESEGDPHFRARRMQTMRQMSRRRSLAEVPKATVVVTNPTHFAVALAYERGRDTAPRVVAKGADLVAKRIREIADQNGVPIVSNPPLARALFLVEEEAQVPAEHFGAVAEVIAFVWRLQARRGV